MVTYISGGITALTSSQGKSGGWLGGRSGGRLASRSLASATSWRYRRPLASAGFFARQRLWVSRRLSFWHSIAEQARCFGVRGSGQKRTLQWGHRFRLRRLVFVVASPMTHLLSCSERRARLRPYREPSTCPQNRTHIIVAVEAVVVWSTGPRALSKVVHWSRPVVQAAVGKPHKPSRSAQMSAACPRRPWATLSAGASSTAVLAANLAAAVLSLSMVDASCATSTAVPAASDEGGGLFRDCRATTSIGDGRRDRDQVVPNTPPSTAAMRLRFAGVSWKRGGVGSAGRS